MRSEEKEVDGLELERAEHLRASELEKRDEEAIEPAEGEELRDVDLEHRDEVLAAMRTILAREQLVINDLELPAKELRALEALKAAVDGRDTELDQFVYASDRSELLEQALGVLQPSIAEMPAEFHDLVHQVGELRHSLDDLEDAQDELLEGNPDVGVVTSEGDRDDKPKPEPGAKPGAKPRSEPTGDDDTSLTGPERRIVKPPSSLSGPALPETPKPPSSLGDPADLAEAARRPWWKRGTGE